MIKISDYISNPPVIFNDQNPWDTCLQSEMIILSLLKELPEDYDISSNIAVHKTAIIEVGAILKSPCIIGPNCFIASHAYLRGGVYLDANVIIGPACEIKSSFIFECSKVAYFNFIGDSIIGKNVNIEAGAIIANYRNELESKEIICVANHHKINTGVDKFGALVGDGSKIGANTVLAPGTIIARDTIVNRLNLIDQLSEKN